MEGQKVSDQFLDYIIESGKTKLTADMLYDEFKSSGYYQKCIDNVSADLQEAVSYWTEEHWKFYIYNYVKLQLGIKAMLGEKELAKIVI